MSKRKLPQIQKSNFYEVINQSIKEGRHVDQLKEMLEDYKKYQQVFSEAFTDSNSLEAVYIFRAKYISDKTVWRDIAILGKQTFCDLAEAIICWMEWNNDHMHGFSIKKALGKNQNPYSQFSMYSPGWEDDPHPTYKTNEVKIADIDYKKNPQLYFVFDFGDGHEFNIELKKIDENIKIKDFEEPLPTCIDQRGVAPIQYPNYQDDERDIPCELDDNCPLCQELKKNNFNPISSPKDFKKTN